MLDAANTYTEMQRSYYETTADLMNVENHRIHNGNRDYWDILVSDTLLGFRAKVGLDFGCGCGRNVINLWNRFARMDGVDISANNLMYARQHLAGAGVPQDAYRLHQCSGVDLAVLPDAEYDFVMSTVVLQHIAVHDIRLSYLREFHRVMRPGALLSFQMGFGPAPGQGRAEYYDNHWDAQGTNSAHDVMVTDPAQIQGDLERVGFEGFSHAIRPAFDDGHAAWIYVKARRP